jgi:hypothetical protein
MKSTTHRYSIRHHGVWFAIFGLLLWASTPPATVLGAEQPSGTTVGLAVAGELDGGSQGFTSGELYLRVPLPWHGHLGRWTVAGQAQIGIAGLRVKGDSSTLFAAGPLLVVTSPTERWYGEVGSRAALLTNLSLGDVDLGYPLEFISHAEAGFILGNRTRLGFRIQHISNGGLGDRNPGLNLFSLQLQIHP